MLMQRRGARFTGPDKLLRHSFTLSIPSSDVVQMLGHLHDATILDGVIAEVRRDLGGVPARSFSPVVC